MYDVPKSPKTIRSMVMKCCSGIRDKVKSAIKIHLQKAGKFSLTFDEWTSVRNRRYMNINVHTSEKFWNVGLLRVKGSLPSDKCLELLQQKLQEFDLNLENHIVAIW